MTQFRIISDAAATLGVEAFTLDFSIVLHIYGAGASGLEDIRRSVRGSPGAVSYKLRNMVETGVVQRTSRNDDRRASLYSLTPEAVNMLDTVLDKLSTARRPATQVFPSLTARRLSEADNHVRTDGINFSFDGKMRDNSIVR